MESLLPLLPQTEETSTKLGDGFDTSEMARTIVEYGQALAERGRPRPPGASLSTEERARYLRFQEAEIRLVELAHRLILASPPKEKK